LNEQMEAGKANSILPVVLYDISVCSIRAYSLLLAGGKATVRIPT